MSLPTYFPRRPSAHAVDENTSLLSSSSESAHHKYSTPHSTSSPNSLEDGTKTGFDSDPCQNKGRIKISEDVVQPGRDLHALRAVPETYFHFAELPTRIDREDVPYPQFTAIDWPRERLRQKRSRPTDQQRSPLTRLKACFMEIHTFLVMTLIGLSTGIMAYTIEILERWLFDIRFGHCQSSWLHSKRSCCMDLVDCPEWDAWSNLSPLFPPQQIVMEYLIYTASTVLLACLACYLAIQYRLRHHDTNGSAGYGMRTASASDEDGSSARCIPERTSSYKPLDYPATGSGVAEVRVILSGFSIRSYLSPRALFLKSSCLILSVASGLCIGKEGPFVHISCAIANLVSRLVPQHKYSEIRHHEILSAGAACGIAVAFGAPISGLLFVIEEARRSLSRTGMLRVFFACITAAAILQILNPYGTSSIALFQVHVDSAWHPLELGLFLLLGILGGSLGAGFIQASRLWSKHVRRLPLVRRCPLSEVASIAAVTGLATFWNQYTSISAADLLSQLCTQDDSNLTGGPAMLLQLFIAFLMKLPLTVVTFGIKVPAGIFIPSMVLGALLGRFVGLGSQLVLTAINPSTTITITPSVHAFVAAAATMCGVTRLTITTVMVMLELSGSLVLIVPLGVAVMAARWTAEALEPRSVYDVLAETNRYPYIDSVDMLQSLPGSLAAITQYHQGQFCIDVAENNTVDAAVLQTKLTFLQEKGEHDGSLVVLREGSLVGAIPTEKLDKTLNAAVQQRGGLDFSCRVMARHGYDISPDTICLAHLVETSIIKLDLESSPDVLFEYFVKLGSRQVFVLRQGRYYGMIHKKTFIKYLHDCGRTAVNTRHETCPIP